MTLADIAEASGSSVSTISEISQGRTKQPRGQLALRLYELRPDAWPEPEPPEARDVA